MEDIYKLVETYRNDSEKHCCSIEIFSPVIDDKEQKRRMEDIKNTSAVYMAEVYRICTKRQK
jgi:hypothetical protein